jgi:hypothetical protein
MAKQRPKVGDPRVKQFRLTIDALPVSVGEAIKDLRADYPRTWAEIEQLSALPYKKEWRNEIGSGGFVDWDSLEADVLALFPTRRLPMSTLRRWYDLRYEQVRDEFLEIAEKSKHIGKILAEGGIENIDDAAIKGASSVIFAMLTSASDEAGRANTAKLLLDLACATQEIRKNAIRERVADVGEREVTVSEQKLELVKQKSGALIKKIESGPADKPVQLTREQLLEQVKEIYGAV